jgi:hypothetical protein
MYWLVGCYATSLHGNGTHNDSSHTPSVLVALHCMYLQTLIKYLPGFRPPEVLPNEADSHMQNPEQYAQQLQVRNKSTVSALYETTGAVHSVLLDTVPVMCL